MRRLWLSIRIFFLTLCSRAAAEQVADLLGRRAGKADGDAAKAAKPAAAPAPAAKKAAPRPAGRSEAITLLAALQREARFVDFVQEPLDNYADAQIGAAARDVHRQCAKLLERLFALRPIRTEAEGTAIEAPTGFDAGRYRLTGNVTGAGPFCGRLVHHGWEAEQCQLPAWTGSETAARVVAPVEIEL